MMDRSHEFHEFAIKMMNGLRVEPFVNNRPSTPDEALGDLRMTLFRSLYEDWEGIR